MLKYKLNKCKLYYNKKLLTKVYNEKKSFTDPEVIKQSQKVDKILNELDKYKYKNL